MNGRRLIGVDFEPGDQPGTVLERSAPTGLYRALDRSRHKLKGTRGLGYGLLGEAHRAEPDDILALRNPSELRC